jgi:hypothetical protein
MKARQLRRRWRFLSSASISLTKCLIISSMDQEMSTIMAVPNLPLGMLVPIGSQHSAIKFTADGGL